jgi:hypothetical protein
MIKPSRFQPPAPSRFFSRRRQSSCPSRLLVSLITGAVVPPGHPVRAAWAR